MSNDCNETEKSPSRGLQENVKEYPAPVYKNIKSQKQTGSNQNLTGEDRTPFIGWNVMNAQWGCLKRAFDSIKSRLVSRF